MWHANASPTACGRALADLARAQAAGVLDDWGLEALTSDGSDTSGRRAAAMYTLIETAKLNGIDPQAWLADVLVPLPGHPPSRSPTCSLHLVTGRRMPPSTVRPTPGATLSPAKS